MKAFAAIASFTTLVLLAPTQGSAQTLQSFDQLALRVNLGDEVEVEDQSGAKTSGRLTRLTRDDMDVQVASGEKRFTSEAVRGVAMRGHALRRGALVGTAVSAALGMVAICAHRGGGDCAFVGAVGAAPIGAGLGVAIGALIPQVKTVYRAESRTPPPPSQAGAGTRPSLLEDLALRVNLDDQIRVENQAGVRTTGRLTRLTDDEITIENDAGETRFTRDTMRQVGVRHRRIRVATLIGAGAGAVWGGLSECRGGARAECPDGLIMGSALGAGAGALVGLSTGRTTVVFPQPEQRTFVVPAISRRGASVRVSRRW